ncbi:hypothetical protein [Maribacter sp. 2210JD10-5]
MIYIKFQDLCLEKQEELLQCSREHVVHLFGDSIKSTLTKRVRITNV